MIISISPRNGYYFINTQRFVPGDLFFVSVSMVLGNLLPPVAARRVVLSLLSMALCIGLLSS
jgi:hypothetical protein